MPLGAAATKTAMEAAVNRASLENMLIGGRWGRVGFKRVKVGC
jgi:hypothetical protein